MLQSQQLIQDYALEPHPEGGFYKRNYCSTNMLQTPKGPRPFQSHIFYLLGGEDFSAFHRIQSDETWTYLQGNTKLKLYTLNKIGVTEACLDHSQPILTVPAGTWFAAKLEDQSPESYVLCACIVSPGFDFQDFELASRDQLLQDFPEQAAIIHDLTRAGPSTLK